MHYSGHVENGAIVLDEPVVLREGVKVRIALIESAQDGLPGTPLRGTRYSFDEPFLPAVEPDDWDAQR